MTNKYVKLTKVPENAHAGNDSKLLPIERETHLSFNEEEMPQLDIESSSKHMIQVLLKLHKLGRLEVKHLYVKEHDPKTVYYITGTTKIGFLRFKTAFASSMNYLSRIIS